MSGKFYECKETGIRLVKYEEIGNGLLLTRFDEKTGTPIVNSHYKIYVTQSALDEEWTPIDFKIDSTIAMNRLVASTLYNIAYEMQNYGVYEDHVRSLLDFYHSSPEALELFRDMAKTDEDISVKDYGKDEWEYAEADDLIGFFHKGLTPILKKMLIENEK